MFRQAVPARENRNVGLDEQLTPDELRVVHRTGNEAEVVFAVQDAGQDLLGAEAKHANRRSSELLAQQHQGLRKDPGQQGLQHAERLAESFPVTDKGLFLQGPPGVGKTHLAVAVLRQVSDELDRLPVETFVHEPPEGDRALRRALRRIRDHRGRPG